MVNAWMKGATIGVPLGILFVALLHLGFVTFLILVVALAVLASMMDWYGQGDGREGCNLHTSCDH